MRNGLRCERTDDMERASADSQETRRKTWWFMKVREVNCVSAEKPRTARFPIIESLLLSSLSKAWRFPPPGFSRCYVQLCESSWGEGMGVADGTCIHQKATM